MTDDPGEEHVRLPERALSSYVRFSLYNSPYPAHDRGCAIDLYRDPDRDDNVAFSPVAGEVLDTHERRVPQKEYAETTDHIVLVDVDEGASEFAESDTADLVARMLHVAPTVAPGHRVEVGDPLGRLVRSGFYAPWVDDHVHLGFRRRDQHLLRAGGSLPLSLPVEPRPLAWDGTGTVVETGETYVVLDAPSNETGEWVGVAADGGGVLDGGLAHYDGGGLLGGGDVGGGNDGDGEGDDDRNGPVSLLGYEVGSVSNRTVEWGSFDVLANGERVTGLSLFCARDRGFGAKVVHPGHGFEIGDHVEVGFRENEDPIRLG